MLHPLVSDAAPTSIAWIATARRQVRRAAEPMDLRKQDDRMQSNDAITLELLRVNTQTSRFSVPVNERQAASAPLDRSGALNLAGSVVVAAGPDEDIAVTAFDRDQRGEDWGEEARVVELDRKIFAARV